MTNHEYLKQQSAEWLADKLAEIMDCDCCPAAEETRKVVENMRLLVNEKCPEFKDYLVPMCEYAGCHEMKPCGRKSNVGE